MTNYIHHLFTYIELRRRSPNRKLLRAWVDFLESHNIPGEEMYNYIALFFLEDEHYRTMTCNTRRQYVSEINLFCEYVFRMEGWVVPFGYSNVGVLREIEGVLDDGSVESEEGDVWWWDESDDDVDKSDDDMDESGDEELTFSEREEQRRQRVIRELAREYEYHYVPDDEYKDFLERYERLTRDDG